MGNWTVEPVEPLPPRPCNPAHPCADSQAPRKHTQMQGGVTVLAETTANMKAELTAPTEFGQLLSCSVSMSVGGGQGGGACT